MELIDKEALRKNLIEKGFLPAIVARAIDRAPVVEAEPIRHAYWKTSELGNPVCSYCGYEWGDCGEDVYCSHCGALMDMEAPE